VIYAGTASGPVYASVSVRPVLDAGGHPTGAVLSVYDDAVRKLSERALDDARAELERSNTELESYASIVSHDLKQPLATITGFAHVLQDRCRGRLDAEADTILERIIRAAATMTALVDDLLIYSRVTSQPSRMEPVDLNELMGEITTLLARRVTESHARITTDPLRKVTGDRTQLIQLFQNLIANALTYVPPGEPPDVRVWAAREELGWRISIADRGIGVAPGDREREQNPGGGSVVSFTISDRPRPPSS
jgi:light-regulated signal transduction histidine kinase (bacteriophytochrome)